MSSVVPFPLVARMTSSAPVAKIKPRTPSLLEQELALRAWVGGIIDSHGADYACVLLDSALARLRTTDR